MKPVVVDKDDFESRNKSEVIAFFGNFGLSRFWCEEKIEYLICKSISTRFKPSTENKKEDTKALVAEKWEIQYVDGT